MLPVTDEAEVTLEANPGATEIGAFAAWREAGVNRVSIGVQSLNPQGLKVLGRIHDAATAKEAVAAALKHFPRVNADLITGWPGQTPEGAAAEVAELRSIVLAAEAPTPVAEEKPAKGKKAAAEEEVPA